MKQQRSSRRNFIKASALSALAIGLAPNELLAEEYNDSSFNAGNEKNLIFLFQGDSITDGNRGRNTDPNHIMGHGYAFAVASRVGADFPGNGLSFFNRGISGNKIPDLQKRWQTDTIDIKPDVLSILIGINDVSAAVSNPAEAPGIDDFETGYRKLLKESKAANPDILFVLGLPFVYAVGNRKENWEAWRDGTEKRAATVRKLVTEFNAVLIDYPSVFDKALKKAPAEYWIWDGIHPTVFAHELMAREWIKQVSSRLRFLRKYKY
jgi:lysophospholipase L1-like esterase